MTDHAPTFATTADRYLADLDEGRRRRLAVRALVEGTVPLGMLGGFIALAIERGGEGGPWWVVIGAILLLLSMLAAGTAALIHALDWTDAPRRVEPRVELRAIDAGDDVHLDLVLVAVREQRLERTMVSVDAGLESMAETLPDVEARAEALQERMDEVLVERRHARLERDRTRRDMISLAERRASRLRA